MPGLRKDTCTLPSQLELGGESQTIPSQSEIQLPALQLPPPTEQSCDSAWYEQLPALQVPVLAYVITLSPSQVGPGGESQTTPSQPLVQNPSSQEPPNALQSTRFSVYAQVPRSHIPAES